MYTGGGKGGSSFCDWGASALFLYNDPGDTEHHHPPRSLWSLLIVLLAPYETYRLPR